LTSNPIFLVGVRVEIIPENKNDAVVRGFVKEIKIVDVKVYKYQMLYVVDDYGVGRWIYDMYLRRVVE